MHDTMTFLCSKCGLNKPRIAFHETRALDRQREVTSRCRECRKETRYESLYPETICAQCLLHRELDQNKICADCNRESGLQECRRCKEMLPLFLSYHVGRRQCIACQREMRIDREKAARLG